MTSEGELRALEKRRRAVERRNARNIGYALGLVAACWLGMRSRRLGLERIGPQEAVNAKIVLRNAQLWIETKGGR